MTIIQYNKIILLLLLTMIIVCNCSIGDRNLECCQSVSLNYRYIRQAKDEYNSHITSMRHFLFDEEGFFIREVPMNKSHPQKLKLKHLEEGKYTMVTIANFTDKLSRLSDLSPNLTKLNDFKLQVVGKIDKNKYRNTDKLFWNTRDFEVKRKKTLNYICDLSNIHCELQLKIYWHTKPPYTKGKYTLELEQVPINNYLSKDKVKLTKLIRKDDDEKEIKSTTKQVVHSFPSIAGKFATHQVQEELFGSILYADFVTLRYTNKYIPTFRLFYQGKQLIKDIDLAKALKSWLWFPDEHTQQFYRLEIEIFDDGKVLVKQWVQTTVLDWVDGGIISS